VPHIHRPSFKLLTILADGAYRVLHGGFVAGLQDLMPDKNREKEHTVAIFAGQIQGVAAAHDNSSRMWINPQESVAIPIQQ